LSSVTSPKNGARRLNSFLAAPITWVAMLATQRRITTYDFRRPNKLNREHVRALQIVGETFARQFTTILSTSLRTLSQVRLEDVTQRTYGEYVQGLPNPTLLTVLELAPLEGLTMFDLPTAITMSIVERLLGGSGQTGTTPNRAPTEIEMRLLRGMLDRVLRELAYSFESLIPVAPKINRIETNPQFAQVTATTDMIIVVDFMIRVGDVTGNFGLAMPFNSLQPALEDTGETDDIERENRRSEIRSRIEVEVGAAEMDVRVRFDEALLPSKALASLQPGDILHLNHPIDEPLTIEVAGLPRFKATAGTRGKRVACLLTDTINEVTR
jgi:flagellar motor switch protein FliM